MRDYNIKYAVEEGQFTKEELKNGDFGGCDAIIIHSLIYPEDGSRSEIIFTADGKGSALPSLEVFKSWVMLASHLANAEDLSAEKKELCSMIFETVRGAILSARKADYEEN